jgi:hypothetical protein
VRPCFIAIQRTQIGGLPRLVCSPSLRTARASEDVEERLKPAWLSKRVVSVVALAMQLLEVREGVGKDIGLSQHLSCAPKLESGRKSLKVRTEEDDGRDAGERIRRSRKMGKELRLLIDNGSWLWMR